MSVSPMISRRRWLAMMGAAVGLASLPVRAEEEKPSDRGIGGTGITSRPDAGPGQGIGFIGTIQRFGSIYVNDARIRYPSDVVVRIDGRARTAKDLKIGQVVRTVAMPEKEGLATGSIDVVSEVVGPIDRIVSAREFLVFGQTVLVDGAKLPSGLAPGARVAVSGIRRPDDVIVATLVEPAGSRVDQIVGRAVLKGWLLHIGSLKLLGINPNFAGQRIVVQGKPAMNGLVVSRARLDTLPLGPNVARVSIETYIASSGANAGRSSDPTIQTTTVESANETSLRVIVNAALALNGQMNPNSLAVEALRSGLVVPGRAMSLPSSGEIGALPSFGQMPSFGSALTGPGGFRGGPGFPGAMGGGPFGPKP